MSNQSGIQVSHELAAAFPDFVQSSEIAAILQIDHGRECVVLHKRVKGNLEDVQRALAPGKEASYMALRHDDGLAFVQFMPDFVPLSSRMKYASSHSTVFLQLGGSSLFTTSIFWSELEDISESGLRAHFSHEQAPAPMTDKEASLASAILSQGMRGQSVAGQSTLAIHANVSQKAQDSLKNLGTDTALIFKVTSADSESIDLVAEKPLSELAHHFKNLNEPRYVVAKVAHKIVFAFTCPRQASIKQRMLFASTRIAFSEYLKTLMTMNAQIETFDPEKDLQIENIEAELEENSPVPESQKPKFSRPRPPKRR